jgi:diguanylate cyclase (GGDEF)-like protein
MLAFSGRGADNHGVPSATSVAVQPSFAMEVLDALPDATAILDREGSIVAVNRVWRMFALDNGGRPEATGVGVNYLNVCARSAETGCADAGEVFTGLQAVLSGATVESDREYACPSPAVGRWFNSRITPIGGSTGGALVSHVNISRRIRSEQDLTHRASHDSLTGLGNRMQFAEELRRALGTQRGRRRSKADVGVLYIDLDGFKAVNDTFGHDAGDEVLLNSAHRMRSQLRPQDCVARLGGDEFAICAQRMESQGLAQLALRVEAVLATPHQIHGKEVVVGGSIGLHIAAAGESVSEAIRLADQAMYVVKTSHHDPEIVTSAEDLDLSSGDGRH